MKTKTTARLTRAQAAKKATMLDADVIDLTVEEDEDLDAQGNRKMDFEYTIEADPKARARSRNSVQRKTGNGGAFKASSLTMETDDDEDSEDGEDNEGEGQVLSSSRLESFLRDHLGGLIAAGAPSMLATGTPMMSHVLNESMATPPPGTQNSERRSTRSNRTQQGTPCPTGVPGNSTVPPHLTPEKWTELKETLQKKGWEQIQFWEGVLEMLEEI